MECDMLSADLSILMYALESMMGCDVFETKNLDFAEKILDVSCKNSPLGKEKSLFTIFYLAEFFYQMTE